MKWEEVDSFETVDELRRWLTKHDVDTSAWGKGGAKRVVDLWQELQRGDARLETGPVQRTADVIQVIISKDNTILLEVEQEFGTGEIRRRERPPSEKVKAGEGFDDAARRCLHEELDIAPADVTLDPSTYEQTQQVAESPSYPGLTTKYTVHSVGASAQGLPDSDFWRDNKAFGSGDPVRRHRFSWRAITR